ncbi:putative Ig domain-containing protein, partial [Gemmatimonadota bacterium]
MPFAVLGQPYAATLRATGGDGSFLWSFTGGTPPPGITLNPSTGVLSGTPTLGGTFLFTVQVSSAGTTATTDLRIVVFAGLTVTTASLPDGAVGGYYSVSLTASGGDTPLIWSIVTGAVPPGLSFASNGSITGYPTTVGLSNFTVRVQSGDGQIADAALSINVTTFNCSAQSQIPLAECQALVALHSSTNGTSWTNDTGWLANDTPCGWFGVGCSGGSVSAIALSGNNLTGGMPSQLGNLTGLVSLDLSMNGLTGAVPSTLGGLSNLQDLRLYNNQLSGALPSQLGSLSSLVSLLAANNQFSGSIPSALGSLSNLVQLNLANSNFTGAIPGGLASLSNLDLLRLADNQLSDLVPLAVAQLGGLIQDSNPASSCQFAPGNSGLYMLDDAGYNAADLDGDNIICGLGFTPVLVITTASLPGGQVGTAYNQTLAATGGDGNYTWSIVGGALPAGLSLAPSTGVISGNLQGSRDSPRLPCDL